MDKYEEKYYEWKNNPTPKNLANVINSYGGILHSELPKYLSGNLPAATIKGYGKKYIYDALKTFQPGKGSLKNHIVTNLQRLHRVNYNTSSFFRMSEELQQGVNNYKSAKEYLTDKLGREPTFEELSKKLKWSISKVSRTESQLNKESLSGNLDFSPAYISSEDPKIDYLYHDLDPNDKIIFQYRTGYRGVPVLGVTEIAKKINKSPSSVSIRAMGIADKLNKILGAK